MTESNQSAWRGWVEDAVRALFWYAVIAAIVLFSTSDALTYLYVTF